MNERLSKSQIDKLGERLKDAQPSETDLEMLDQYRRTFGDAYDAVVRTVSEQLKLESTGRPAKTIPSIREKLRRESIRLTQIQDIAGCRVVVDDLAQQERAVDRLRSLFPQARVIDRRALPSYGYRAVHVVPAYGGKRVEIQVRTSLQQRWAEISERCSDVDPEIKYGGGNQDIAARLLELSAGAYRQEQMKEEASLMEDEVRRLRVLHSELVTTIERRGRVETSIHEGLASAHAAMVAMDLAHLDSQNAFRAAENSLSTLFDAFSAAIESLKR